MKRTFFLLTMSSLVLFSEGCNDDDSGSCIQDDFLGTYNVTSKSCDDPRAEVDTDLYNNTVGASANEIMITDDSGFSVRATINGCSFTTDEVEEFGFTNNTTGSLDGITLTVTDRVSFSGVPFLNCTFVGKK